MFGITSSIYLIIFLPLITAFLCQLFNKKAAFLLSLTCALVIFILLIQIFPQINEAKIIANDFELSPLSIALEFSVDKISYSFLFVLVLLKLIILFYYHQDIKQFLDEKNSKIFYSIYLLHFFSIIGIIITNNLLNLFIFFEIYACSFLSIFSISKNKDISKLCFNYFSFNAIGSLLILFSFIIIYLNFGSFNLDIIKNFLINMPNDKFIFLLTSLIATGFIIKFFPFWLYFENLKNSNLLSNYFAIDSLFIKANLGIFLALKFSYLFFSSIIINVILIFLCISLIIYTSYRLYKSKHFKLIVIYSCLSNFAFILICLALNHEKSLFTSFFFWLNFVFINFFLFLFASFLQRKFSTSAIDKISLILLSRANQPLIWPLRLILIFVVALPFTFLFYGNLFLLNIIVAYDAKTIAVLIAFAMIINNFALFILGGRLFLVSFFNREINSSQEDKTVLKIEKYWLYLISFWLIVIIVYALSFSELFKKIIL